MSARLAALAAAFFFILAPAASADPVFEPDPVEFPATAVGSASAPIEVTVSNDSADVFEIADVVLDGDDAVDFEILSDSCSGTDLDESSSCVVSLRFAPAPGPGGDSVAVLVLENAGAGDDYGVLVGGYAYNPPTIETTQSLDFGSARRGATSSATALVTNPSDLPVVLGPFSIGGPQASGFGIVSNGCTGIQELGPHSSCEIELYFSPARLGPNTGTLSFDSDAANAPHAVQLAGTGLAAGELRAEPAALDFGVMSLTATREVTVRNTGDNAVSLKQLITGSSTAALLITRGSNCSAATLAPGQACRLVVTLNPRGVGPFARDIELRDRRTNDLLVTVPVRAEVKGLFLAGWAGRAQLDIPLADAGRDWRRASRRALRRRGFAVEDVSVNLPGRLTLNVYALLRPRANGSTTARRLLARGPGRAEPRVPVDVVARTTRVGRRLLARRGALRLRARLRFDADDGRSFATGLTLRLPARR